MSDYFKKLVAWILGMAVLVGIPYFFGWAWMFISWLPAFFTVMFLQDDY